MSGGSYDYLCYADPDNLFGRCTQIESMRDRLVDFDAEDAAEETESLLLIMRQFEVRVRARLNRLSPVWKAVEWRDSNDYGDDQVRQAIAEYRGEKEQQ